MNIRKTALNEISALWFALLTGYIGYQYTNDYVTTWFLITIADTLAYNLPKLIVNIVNNYSSSEKGILYVFFMDFWKLILVKVQTTSVLYIALMVLFAPTFKSYLLWIIVSFVLANSIYYLRERYNSSEHIQKILVERSVRYIPAELSATIWAVIMWNIVMIASWWNTFISWLVITSVDNILYYWVILIKDLRSLKERNTKKIFVIIRNIMIEFWPAEVVQSLIIYPLFLTYIPALFSSYSLWVMAWMITANSFFYRMVIPIYERRKKNLVS